MTRIDRTEAPPPLPPHPQVVTDLDGLHLLTRRADVRSALVIADPASREFWPRLRAHLEPLPTGVHALPPHEPSLASVGEAVKRARILPQPLIVGVGGGSALDTAKLVAALLESEFGVEHYLLAAHVFTARRPLAAVPTTSGTGAEVTRVCVLSDRAGRKLWAAGEALRPDLALLLPELTVSMPAPLTVMTGLDALAHAVEACTGGGRTPEATGWGLEAIRLIRRHLPEAVRRPDDLAARRGMQAAALLAGLAFDHSALGVAHSLGHALGTLYHLPHGLAVGVALEATLAWNMAGNPEPYRPVAAAFGVEPERMPAALEAFYHALDVGVVVAQFGDPGLDVAALTRATDAPENRPMLATNARSVLPGTLPTLVGLTVEAWHRWGYGPGGVVP